jgi:hypothetical protein
MLRQIMSSPSKVAALAAATAFTVLSPMLVPSLAYGQNCPAGTCTGNRPRYTDPAFAPFSGKLAAMTFMDYNSSASAALTLFNLRDDANATFGGEWEPVAGPSVPYRYTGPAAAPWSRARLGTVFGLTLNNNGDIFLGHTSILQATFGFSLNEVGSVGGGNTSPNGFGVIYKIDAVTGAASVFQKLPNGTTLGFGPGLGNIHFDGAFGQLFASNFEDGRIYRLHGSTGGFLSSYDHSLNLITHLVGATLVAEVGDLPGKVVPLGERIWAVQTHQSRLYYGVWNRDLSGGVGLNEVWSIALLPNGEFSAGTARLETSVGTMPIADISFSNDGRMLVAERGMAGPVTTSPHQSALREYSCVSPAPATGNRWMLTSANTGGGSTYIPVGNVGGTNTAGGCDYDYSPGGRIFATGDYLTPIGIPVYGFTSINRTNTAVTSSYSSRVQVPPSWEKTEMGDIEVICPPECLRVVARASCESDPATPGNFTLSGTLRNLSSTNNVSAIITALSGGTIVSSTSIVPSINAGQTLPFGPVRISGPAAGGIFTYTVTMYAPTGLPICSKVLTVTLPPCDCLNVTSTATCNTVTGAFTWTPTITNNTSYAQTYVSLLGPANVTFSPGTFPLIPALLPGQTRTLAPITITGSAARPNQTICFSVMLHDAALTHCCGKEVCVTLPSCGPGGPGTWLSPNISCCPPIGRAAAGTLRVCNPTNVAGAYNWSLAPRTGTGCTQAANLNGFTDGNGTMNVTSGTVNVPAMSCVDVPIKYHCEYASAYNSVHCYSATVSGPGVFTTLPGRITGPNIWCNVIFEGPIANPGSFSHVNVGTVFDGGGTATNDGDLPWNFSYWVGTDSGTLMIDGIPGPTLFPGANVTIPPGGSFTFNHALELLEGLGDGVAEFTIYFDVDGDGYPDPYATYGFAEQREIAGCIGDHNQDGGIDGSDVTEFFRDWSEGNVAADVNQDGGVDGTDVDVFFAAWSAGC